MVPVQSIAWFPKRRFQSYSYGLLSSLLSLSYHDIDLLSHNGWTSMYSYHLMVEYMSDGLHGCDCHIQVMSVVVSHN